MTDQGAIESIAKAHAAHVVYYGTPEAKCVCGWKGEDGDVHLAKVSLDALAADGYSVVKAEWEYGVQWSTHELSGPYADRQDAELMRSGNATIHRRRKPGPWEPVPEGSEDE